MFREDPNQFHPVYPDKFLRIDPAHIGIQREISAAGSIVNQQFFPDPVLIILPESRRLCNLLKTFQILPGHRRLFQFRPADVKQKPRIFHPQLHTLLHQLPAVKERLIIIVNRSHIPPSLLILKNNPGIPGVNGCISHTVHTGNRLLFF